MKWQKVTLRQVKHWKGHGLLLKMWNDHISYSDRRDSTPSPYPSSTRFMLTSEIFGIIRHFEHNFQLFSEKSTASINFTFGQLLRIQLANVWVRDQCYKTFWCLFSFTLMRLGSQEKDSFAGLNSCAFTLTSSVTQYGVVVRQFCCLSGFILPTFIYHCKFLARQ